MSGHDMTSLADPASAAGEPDRRSWYVLILLTAAAIISFVDRYVLAVLVEPIKADLGFSDTQIGLLTGFAFAAFYAVFGILIARIADRGRRRNVIVISLMVWSAMTAACGAARTFVTFALARFGVGAGEAGAMPASLALIADIFPIHRRNMAMAVLGSGSSIGLILAFVISGYLEALYGWRLTFLIVSVPGILLAILIWATVSEPRTARATEAEIATSARRGHRLRDFLAEPVFRHLPLAQATLALLLFAQLQWLPAYVERSFALPRMQIGPMLALTNGLAGILGMIVGGFVADRLVRRGTQWPIRVAIAGVMLATPAMLALYLTSNANVAFAMAALMGFCLSAPAGPVFALVQSLVPRDVRATAAASFNLCASVIGLGAGPLVIGMLSDWMEPSQGVQSLRWGLLITVGVTLPWCLFHFIRVERLLAVRTDDKGSEPG